VKKILTKLFSFILSAVIGAAFAGVMIYYLETQKISWLISGIVLICSVVFQLAIHEMGHGIFGKLTGYKLVSFRLFSWMWVWHETGGVSFKKQKIAGTLGQCLMSPPQYVKGKYPFKLYLLGGVLANLSVSLLVLPLVFLSSYVLIFSLIGLLFFFTNAIPMGFNDGMAYRLANQNPTNTYLLYLQLKTTDYFNQGKTYLDLPEDYFKDYSDEVERSYILDFQSTLICGKYLELLDFEQERLILEEMWRDRAEMILPYQIWLKSELLFNLCLLDSSDERMPTLFADKLVQKTLKQKQQGSKRILVAYTFYVENNAVKALDILNQGKRMRQNAPNLADAKIETKLSDWLENDIRNQSLIS
jgi:hypothetical protein